MERLLRLGGQGLSGMGSQSPESSQNDTAVDFTSASRNDNAIHVFTTAGNNITLDGDGEDLSKAETRLQDTAENSIQCFKYIGECCRYH